MTEILASVLVTSLAGSLHCVGMCGGLVAVTASPAAPGVRRSSRPIFVYHLGRLLAYAALGAGAGALGSALDVVGSAAGFMDVAAILAGVTIVAMGGIGLARALGARIPSGPRFAAVSRWLGKVLETWRERPPVLRALVLGLLTALLPCGWLWAFLVTAAGTASALWGALVMATFFLGTVPALLALGLGVRLALTPLARRLPVVIPVLLVGVGLSFLLWRSQLSPPLPQAQPAPVSVPVGQEPPPCHPR